MQVLTELPQIREQLDPEPAVVLGHLHQPQILVLVEALRQMRRVIRHQLAVLGRDLHRPLRLGEQRAHESPHVLVLRVHPVVVPVRVQWTRSPLVSPVCGQSAALLGSLGRRPPRVALGLRLRAGLRFFRRIRRFDRGLLDAALSLGVRVLVFFGGSARALFLGCSFGFGRLLAVLGLARLFGLFDQFSVASFCYTFLAFTDRLGHFQVQRDLLVELADVGIRGAIRVVKLL